MEWIGAKKSLSSYLSRSLHYYKRYCEYLYCEIGLYQSQYPIHCSQTRKLNCQYLRKHRLIYSVDPLLCDCERFYLLIKSCYNLEEGVWINKLSLCHPYRVSDLSLNGIRNYENRTSGIRKQSASCRLLTHRKSIGTLNHHSKEINIHFILKVHTPRQWFLFVELRWTYAD